MTVRLNTKEEIMLEELRKKMSGDIGIKLNKSDVIRILIETTYRSAKESNK